MKTSETFDFFLMYADIYKVENYKYGVTGYTIKMSKIGTHIKPKYANCTARY